MDLETLREDWAAVEGSAQWWDQAASGFRDRPIPTFEDHPLLSLIDKTFAGKTESAIDIGCGGGQYAIALASRFDKVYATDISPKMLEISKSLAADHGCELTCEVADWAVVPRSHPLLNRKYNLVLGNMTPAINSAEAVERMISVCDGACYVTKQIKREDPVMEEFTRIIGQDLNWPKDNFDRMFGLLWNLGYRPKLAYWDIEWGERSRNVEDTYNGFVHNISVDEDRKRTAMEYLESIAVDGFVKHSLKAQVGCMYWDVSP